MSTAFVEFARNARDQIYHLIHYHRSHVDVEGLKLSLNDPVISSRMFYVLCRGYECDEAHLVKQYLNANDCVLEVGGGIGFLALLCTRNIGIKHYWLIEGNPNLIPIIERNLMLNNVGNSEIGIRNTVLAGRDGLAEFHVHRNFWSSSLTARPGTVKKVRVPAQTLSTLVAEMPFRPNVLIIDIEGGEENIELDHLVHFDKILIELHPRIIGYAKVHTLIQALMDVGFENPQEGVFLRRHLGLPS